MTTARWIEDSRTAWQEGTREELVDAGLDPAWVRNLVLRSLDEDLGGRPQRAGGPLTGGRTAGHGWHGVT